MTRFSTRVFAVLATGISALLVAGCVASPDRAVDTVTIVPAAVTTVQTLLEVGGLERTVTIHDVAAASNVLLPAVIALHGAGGSSARMEGVSGLTAIAKENGFVVAYGDGTPIEREVGGLAWNAGTCCAAPVEKNIDDIGYVTAVADELVANHGVDPERIYLGGFSNGGMMSYRSACEIGDRLAGIFVVGGAFNVDACEGSATMPVLVIHGTKDSTVPYAGGEPNQRTAENIGSWVNASVADAASYWSQRDNCDSHSIVTENDIITDDAYEGCADGSKLHIVSVIGGTHRWPTKENVGFDASRFIAEYFELVS